MTSDRADYRAKAPAARLAVGNPKEFASMSAETYRHNAAECLQMSLAVADPAVRGFLKRMAIAWTNLAEQAENGPPHFIVRQHRQSQPKGISFTHHNSFEAGMFQPLGNSAVEKPWIGSQPSHPEDVWSKTQLTSSPRLFLWAPTAGNFTWT